ncbi:F-box associated domain containing protein [Tanacetum coccineum]
MAHQHSMRKRKRIDGLSMIPSRLLLPEIIVEILLRFPIETLLRCSCNGLLCIVTDWISTPFLYNPNTRIYKRLPYSGFGFGVRFTFGYDESSDDYKVVGIYGNKAKM